VLLQRHQEAAFAAAAAPGLPANTVEKIMVFRELHSDRHVHYYAVVLAARPYSWAPVQKALRDGDRVFTTFGGTHSYFWTAVVYAGVPSEHKAPEELDASPWHSHGRTLREELMDMPRGARRAEKLRVATHLGLPAPGASGDAAPDQVARDVLAQQIREENWRDVDALTTYAVGQRAENPLLYNTVLAWGERRLEDFVAWVWRMEGSSGEPQEDRLTRMRQRIDSRQCIC
jgi:hypothetical protein